MSLNRAFITVYSKGDARKNSPRGSAAVAPEQPPSEPQTGGRRGPHPVRRGAARDVIHRMHSAELIHPPETHLRIESSGESARGVEVGEATQAPADVGATWAAPPVTSSITADSRQASGDLRPAWQVDAVLWPAVVEQISTRVSGALDGLCAELSWHVRAGQRVVAVSSCHDGEGRTSMTLVLGRRLAGYGLRVALVDGYLAAPTLAQQLGLSPVHGWWDLIEGVVPLDEALVESASNQLIILPGTSPLDREPTTTEPLLAGSIARLRESCDIVLIDTPPLAGGGSPSPKSVAVFHPDAAILVHDRRATTNAQLQSAIRALRGAGVSTWGVVENFSRNL